MQALSSFIFNNIVGCLGGLMWCYIVVVQFDPNLECPADGCWRVVCALWAWSIVGLVALPWLSLLAMRTLRKGRSIVNGSHLVEGISYQQQPVRAWSRAALEDETLEKARELMARAMGTAWSVGLYSALSASVKQLEFDALSTKAGGLLARCEGKSASFGCALRGVLSLTLAAACIAASVTGGAVLAMGCASRVLARANLSPLVVEMMLMIRSNLYYSVAYSWTTTLGLLWFAPYELGPVADNALTPRSTWDTSVRAAFAAMRAATLVVLFTHLALNNTLLEEPPGDDDVESTAAAPWSTCARLVAFKACAVTVAIAGNDAAQGVIANFDSARKSPRAFDFSLTVSGFAYAAVLLALGALCFACLCTPEHQNAPSDRESRPLFHINRSANRHHSSRGPRFARLVYTWLVIFATWSPWKRLLIAVYSELDRAVGPVVLLPFQVLLALAFSLSLAFAQVVISKLLVFCCGSPGAEEDEEEDNDNDDDDISLRISHSRTATPHDDDDDDSAENP